MRKSIPMLISKKHLRGDGESPRRLIGMSFRLGIPWQVALQQSLPPLSRPQTFCKNRGSSAEQISADGACLTSLLSQKGPQSTQDAVSGLFQQPLVSRQSRESSRLFFLCRGNRRQIPGYAQGEQHVDPAQHLRAAAAVSINRYQDTRRLDRHQRQRRSGLG